MSALSGEIQQPRKANVGRLPVIPQATRLAADAFKRGLQLPASDRNRRFYIYRELYEGETEYVFNSTDYPIINNHRNYFQEVANAFYRFLFSSPPESTSALMPQLLQELRDVVLDFYMHGVSILATSSGEIRHIDPRYFYVVEGEDGESDFATITPINGKQISVRQGTTRQTFDFRDAYGNFLYPQGQLGEAIGVAEEVPEREFHIVSRNPEDDIFGSSLFLEMLPAVAGRTEMMSSYMSQMKISSNILFMNAGEGGVVANLSSTQVAGKTADEYIDISRMLGRAIQNIEEIGFVQGIVDSDAYQRLLDEFEQAVWNTSGISPSLAAQFNDRNVLVQSGVAYTKSFIRTAAELDEVIAELLVLCTEALASAGAPADVTWVNPLDRLDAMQSDVPIRQEGGE